MIYECGILGRQLEVVRDESIPQMAEFFVSNFWENDVGPAQVTCRMASNISRLLPNPALLLLLPAAVTACAPV